MIAKKKHLIIEFGIILVFLILPPLFQSPVQSEKLEIAGAGRFSIQILIQALISALLLWQNSRQPFTGEDKESQKNRLIPFLLWVPMSLGLMMIFQAAIRALSLAFGSKGLESMVFPDSALSWAIYFVNLAVAVIYEETLYRLFLPDVLLNFAGEKKKARVPIEAACILIFAFSHRYMGYPAVINAALCGTALRIAKIRTKTIKAPALSHLIYNILQTIILYLLAKP